MSAPKYAVGDLVMYNGRAQTTSTGMPIQEVDSNMFNTMYKVDYKWWNEGNLMSFEDWKKL